MNLSYEEFVKICFDAIENPKLDKNSDNHYDYNSAIQYNKDGTYAHEFYADWEISGSEGGNCWGDSSRHYISSDKEPEYRGFFDVLENLGASFKQYREILKKEVRKEERDVGYYGNYTDKVAKRISFADIYEILKEG